MKAASTTNVAPCILCAGPKPPLKECAPDVVANFDGEHGALIDDGLQSIRFPRENSGNRPANRRTQRWRQQCIEP
jgi:hypothetical protein